jgi:hypothetical protein
MDDIILDRISFGGGKVLPDPEALHKDPSHFGLLAREPPLLLCGSRERSATPTAGKKHFPASSNECNRAAEPVKAKPSWLLRKP